MMIVTYHSVEVTLFEIIFLQASHTVHPTRDVFGDGVSAKSTSNSGSWSFPRKLSDQGMTELSGGTRLRRADLT